MHYPRRTRARIPAFVCLSAATAVALVSLSAGAAIVPASVVVKAGDMPPGENEVVTLLNSPFTDGDGMVAFTGRLGASDYFVWSADAILFKASDEQVETLTGGESTMGMSSKGGFIYSPSISGADGVWGVNGKIARATEPAAGFPPNTTTTFHSRPTMTPDGTAYWVSGFNDQGGNTTLGRMFYKAIDGDPNNIEVVFRSDDVFGGLAIDRPSGVGFDYEVSSDGAHHIHEVLFDTGSTTNDGAVLVDGMIVARELSPNGTGDNWDNFGVVSINKNGNHLISGDTDGDGATDHFIAYNGQIQIREGDQIAGVTLLNAATVNGLSISDIDTAVHLWGYTGGNEVLFYACDAAAIDESKVVLHTGDEIDLDDDGVGDFTVTDFNASAGIGPGLDLFTDGYVYVEVDIDDGNGAVEAILKLELPSCCGDGKVLEGLEGCDDGNLDDADECTSLCQPAACGDGFVQDGVEACDDGNADDTDECTSLCQPAACGDGFVQDGVEACDDGNADDTDDCTTACQPAACGDGFVQAGVEECDDGNVDDGDGCSAACLVEGGTTDGTTTDGTTDGTTTDIGTSGTDGTTTGGISTGGETTGMASTSGGTSDSGTDSGATTTTTTTSATSAASAASGSTGDTTGTDSATSGGEVLEEDGCGCRADAAGGREGALGLLTLGLLGLVRRRRVRR